MAIGYIHMLTVTAVAAAVISMNGCILADVVDSIPLTGEASDGCPRIVTRSEWGARAPRSVHDIKQPIPRVFVHHTDGNSCHDQQQCSATVRSIQNFHMDTRHWNDIGYNFLVGEDGNVYEGRGWNHVGAQVRGYNTVSLGFSVMGTYDKRLPNAAALTALKALIDCSVQKRKLATNYTLHGHRDGGDTDCPGQKLYDLIRTWPHYGGRLPIPPRFGRSSRVSSVLSRLL